MDDIRRVVILGAGHGGFSAAAALRSNGFEGEIVLLGREAGLPYERPPLSKGYLLGTTTDEAMHFRNAAFYETSSIDYRPSTTVESIDRERQELVVAGGERIAWDRLVIATGASNRPLQTPGADSPNVFGIRSLNDIEAIKIAMESATTVGVIGGGFIGLEFAAAARALGKSVKLYEFLPRLLQRALPQLVSDYIREYHETSGVDFVFSDVVSSIDVADGQLLLHSTDGATAVDLVVYGVGVVANDALAAAAGLVTDNGIIVDPFLQTSDPHILAIGDCARVRVGDRELAGIQSVQNAADQGRHVAETIVGSAEPYAAVPWFWSDQGDVKLQIAGLPGQEGELYLRGSIDSKKFSIATVANGELLCVHSINSPADHVKARRALGAVDAPTIEELGYLPLLAAVV